MYEDEIVLCAASAYEEKFYLNESFASLPVDIKKELQIMCTLFTMDVGGTIELVYSPEGELLIRTEAMENDFSYDEIGSVLKVKQIQGDKRELLESLEMYYRVFFLGEDAPETEEVE
ncbi:MAG: DUF6145 family protein [Eubacterium sp.]|nr:DUF6145 family protein [Eubacterium sp.]